MGKQERIKEILKGLSSAKSRRYIPSEYDLDRLASRLARMDYVSILRIKSILSDEYILREVDFSDTDFWIKKIVDIINEN